LAFGVVLLSAVAAFIAYNAGFSHGIAQNISAQGTPVPFVYGWYRPWGFGFGPIFFIVFLWFLVFRGLWWRGPRWRHAYYQGASLPPAFDEWHRRAHERMKESTSADDPARRG
jgi:hypothetical protein